MEDLKINADLTVRNSNGSIVQFLYGEDGINPLKIEKQSIPTMKMTLSEIKNNYSVILAILAS